MYEPLPVHRHDQHFACEGFEVLALLRGCVRGVNLCVTAPAVDIDVMRVELLTLACHPARVAKRQACGEAALNGLIG